MSPQGIEQVNTVNHQPVELVGEHEKRRSEQRAKLDHRQSGKRH